MRVALVSGARHDRVEHVLLLGLDVELAGCRHLPDVGLVEGHLGDIDALRNGLGGSLVALAVLLLPWARHRRSGALHALKSGT